MSRVYNFFKNELERRKKERRDSLIFKPRSYQKRLVKKYDEGERFLLICWCRRLGKDMLALYFACRECINTPRSIVYYVFPIMKQGKMMILEGFTNEKKRFIEAVVHERAILRPEKSKKLFHSDNSLRFKNGSIIYFVDSTDADTKVGGNLDLVVISEAALIKNPALIDLLMPAIENVSGKLILVSTPRLGSKFNELIEKNDGTFYVDMLNALDERAVDETGKKVWTDEKIEEVRKRMSKSRFEEEILCKLDAATEESIYGYSLSKAEFVNTVNIREKRLYVSLDLGINDSTALVFIINNTVIHHYANVDNATIHYIEYIKKFAKENKITDIEIILPHDARNRVDNIDYLTSREKAYRQHFSNVKVLNAYSVNKTIEVTKHSIEQHKVKFLVCENIREMIKVMKKYEWKIDKTNNENLRIPVHGRGLAASNLCDAFEYFCMRMFSSDYEMNLKEFMKNSNYLENNEGWGSYL